MHKKTRKIVGYADNIVMANCLFVIMKGGKKRAMETGIRNVHAFVDGYIVSIDNFIPRKNRDVVVVDYDETVDEGALIPLMYKPFVDGGFTTLQSEPVTMAKNVVMKVLSKDKVYLGGILERW
jgi:hypothetical protein